jgi:hypothetical protein
VEFVVAIAEPVSRPRFVHEYVVTDVSLHSAVALGLSGSAIVKKLDLLCKTSLPPTLVRFIASSTRHAGKLRLVLFDGRYSLETVHLDILEEVVALPDVRPLIDGTVRTRSPAGAVLPQAAAAQAAASASETGFLDEVAGGLTRDAAAATTLAWQKEFDRDDVEAHAAHIALLLPGKERDIVRACRELGYPLVEVRSGDAVARCLSHGARVACRCTTVPATKKPRRCASACAATVCCARIKSAALQSSSRAGRPTAASSSCPAAPARRSSASPPPPP